MAPRIKFRSATKPLALAGSLWFGAAALVEATAPHCPAPPPCSPDGLCTPNAATYGVYQTRWRRFPGDESVPTPAEAPAEGEAREDQQQREKELQGPVLPEAADETQTGPKPAPGETPADGPAAGAAAPAVEPGPGQPAAPPAGGALPGAEPAEPPSDPFGMIPNPARPSEYAATSIAAESIPMAPPVVTPASASTPKVHAQSDADAPPALPAALKRLSAVANPSNQTSLAQPASVQPPGFDPRRAALATPPAAIASLPEARYDGAVRTASADEPIGIQLVNPAAAIVEQPGVERVQQAIYFEASDQPTELPVVGQ